MTVPQSVALPKQDKNAIMSMVMGKTPTGFITGAFTIPNPGEEVRQMSATVKIGWKFVLALGVAVSTVIFASKMDANAAERVSIHAIDAIRDARIAIHGKN